MVHISNINTLKSYYYAYIHSVIKYGIFFWGNSSNSGKISTLQKKIVRIMAGAQLEVYLNN
jgi:hypothetical protein